MTVPHQNAVVEQGRLIQTHAGKQAQKRGRISTPVEIVVAPDFDVARPFRIGVVELGKPVIDRSVGDVGLIKAPVFPQFLRVAQFNIGKPVFQIIIQGALVQQGVVGKIIRPSPIPTVHVTHDDEPGARRQGQVLNPGLLGIGVFEIAHIQSGTAYRIILPFLH
jgi:hypothetical protein